MFSYGDSGMGAKMSEISRIIFQYNVIDKTKPWIIVL
jgi:hypothetical protein